MPCSELRARAVRSSAMPALVRRTVRCPCGRRSSNVVLAQGQEPLPLLCTAECERQKRAARLANAFGVSNPDNYVPVQVQNTAKHFARCRAFTGSTNNCQRMHQQSGL